MKRIVLAALAGAALLAAAPAQAATQGFEVKVLSSPPTMVTGGDALVQVSIPRTVPLHKATVSVNGVDVTDTLELDAAKRTLTGMVTGLRLGDNALHVDSNGQGNGRPTADLTLVNHPVTGPIFSGPQQQPFLCRTIGQGLGTPLPDNQAGIGLQVPGGWSKDCTAQPKVDFQYRTTGGAWRDLPAGPLPADVATTTTLDGETVPYVIRRERGTINRFIYSISILVPAESRDPAAPPDMSLWNGRLVYSFDGGVAIGHNQGTLGGNHRYHNGLAKGYGVVYSSGTRTATHYNLVLGGETAIMTKERFVEGYGVPLYTVGVGGSGGGIQQYVYAQNHPGAIIDAAVPQYSYPDMVTQTIHVGDCELLEHYMDVTDGANPAWQTWTNRTWLEGMAAWDTIPNPYTGGQPGLSECVNGWRGLTPLAMNPNWFEPWGEMALYPPALIASVKWTHWDDLATIYGVDAAGYGRSTWDNVGVQYGLRALTEGKITPAEFLKLNATVGSWKETKDMTQEGCPFYPSFGCFDATWDPWSRGQMRLSPDGGATPAPRREGSVEAMHAAYESGLVFQGKMEIPTIDWRHYLERELDMHNSHQSFAARQRLLNWDGDASNQVIWFTDGPDVFDQTPQAFEVIDEWMANIRANPDGTVAENKPMGAVDACFTSSGAPIAAGSDVWGGILDGGPKGACAQQFPVFSTSRIVAGGPIEGGVYKCALKPVATAIADGTYGAWTPSAAETARLQQIFPTGVCDYSKPDVGKP